MNLEKIKNRIPEHVYLQIKEFGGSFGVITDLRLAHFLATMNHESKNFTAYEELLNYSAQGLADTFPGRYAINPKTKPHTPNNLALSLHKNKVAIANNCYANRMGNGPEESGDGWKHRGFGAGMITGKENQQKFFQSIGLDKDSDPTIIRDKYPITSAMWYWYIKGFNKLADGGVGYENVRRLRKKYNGGEIGLGKVYDLTRDYYKLLTA